MAALALSNGGVAQIDDDDVDLVSACKWKRVPAANGKHYVAQSRRISAQYLHRVLMCPPPGMVVDHINGDGLDNRRANLRVCTHRQNICNQRKHICTPKNPYKGVYLADGRWVARIGGASTNRGTYIGRFDTAEEAAAAYDIFAVVRFGEFACLNFPHVFPEVPSRRKA